MITKKDLKAMPFFKPFWGPAEVPVGVAWDIFWANTTGRCNLDGMDDTDFRIVPRDDGGGGYPEPEIDHEVQQLFLDAGVKMPAEGYDDDDAVLAALADGLTIVKVPYALDEDFDSYRFLVCAHRSVQNPRTEPSKRVNRERIGEGAVRRIDPDPDDLITISLSMNAAQYQLRMLELRRVGNDRVYEVDQLYHELASHLAEQLLGDGLNVEVVLSADDEGYLYTLVGEQDLEACSDDPGIHKFKKRSED